MMTEAPKRETKASRFEAQKSTCVSIRVDGTDERAATFVSQKNMFVMNCTVSCLSAATGPPSFDLGGCRPVPWYWSTTRGCE